MPYVTEENLTDVALERWKNIPDPRLRQIMQSLIKHLHGFVRDFEPTQTEWATAIDWLTRTGQLCSQKRQELNCGLTSAMPARCLWPSRPGEFHPEPLTDPDLTLSRHPARATARRLPPSIEYRVPPVAG